MAEDQQFILSRVLVRRLLPEARYKLPEDYDYLTGELKSRKSKSTLADEKKDKKTSIIKETPVKSETAIGYRQVDGGYKIEGTTALTDKKASNDIKSCHFVSLIAMLMAAMHPIRTWDHVMVDTCIEKGLEIFQKATNLAVCEKRAIKNIILDGKFININIKRIIVINENPEKTLDQYIKAVLRRLRYVMIKFPTCSLVACQTDGYYHLFNPYYCPKIKPPVEKKESTTSISTKSDKSTKSLTKEQKKEEAERKKRESKIKKEEEKKKKDEEKKKKDDEKKKKAEEKKHKGAPAGHVASWTLFRSLDDLLNALKQIIPGKEANNPEFYTFALTSVKTAPRHSALNYRLSPLFKPDQNPNLPYLKHGKVRPLVDEKMYWLNIETVPWSRINLVNDLGLERNTPPTLWKDWDIEFPGDLYSLWGTIHPLDKRFDKEHRGKQYLATCVVSLGMVMACDLGAWTSSFLDGIVEAGDKYHKKCAAKIGTKQNYEIAIEDLDASLDEMYPYLFTIKFEKQVFGFVYNLEPDRFNLSKALFYFFEKNNFGILVSPNKNLAFGKMESSYFMFDCQSYGVPIFSPEQGAAYILKCESLNRLIYCMTITLNLRRHGQQFYLYSAILTLSEKK